MKMSIKGLTFISVAVILLSACHSTAPYYSRQERDWQERTLPELAIRQEIYLMGDAGEPADSIDPNLALMERLIDQSDPEITTVAYLGDNLYPRGLHKKDHPMRAEDERRLIAQLDVVKDKDLRVIMIPGNHDWKQGKKEGYDFQRRQERFVEDYLDEDILFPDKGCGDPEVIVVDEDLVLIAIDTQWWVHPHKRGEGEKDGCEVSTEADLMVFMEDAFKRHRNKQIVVLGHHPLYSNGSHGGHFPAKQHLFPLTSFNHKLWIPLPILGSIYPGYRKFIGDIQDIPHPHYAAMVESFMALFSEYDRVIYACGHEHNLQYMQPQGVHHLVQGSGSKKTFVKRDRQIDFGLEELGFSRLRIYENGEVWMEYFAINQGSDEAVYRKQLVGPQDARAESVVPAEKPSYADSTQRIVPEAVFEASGTKKFFFGELYRDIWTTAIEVPMLDIHYEKGGLTPLRKGGGMQTKSLRFEGGDGKQYVIRSIQKDPSSVLPKELRNTVTADILHDGIAGAHPYAAIAIPPLASAAGVYHTNPKLVIVPDDPVLGEYREEFAGSLCLFEERPAGDQRDEDSFGNSKDLVNSGEVIEKIKQDQHHHVDAYALVRARLLDMVIGDWDRHDDQWRWARFKQGKHTYYRPVPRDRDQAFFTSDGLVGYFSNRTWTVRKLQEWGPDIRDLAGQNFNARYLDRAYLTGLSESDWLAIADSIQSALSDEVIQSAIRTLPPEGFAINGEEIISGVKSRRDQLKEFAAAYCSMLARDVDIVGTEENEYFQVDRLDDDRTEVWVYHRKKNGKPNREKVHYHRIFNTEETREIRLYGIGGEDEFRLNGEVKKGIMVRVVAGTGTDKIKDESHVKGISKKTRYYDSHEKRKKHRNSIDLGREGKAEMVKKSKALTYDRFSFVHDYVGPVAFLGFNPDDGIYLGGGVNVKRQGFNKKPYASSHTLKANYAFNTGAYNIDYSFDFPQLLGAWDLAGQFDIRAPNNVFFFYGLGNNTERISERQNDYRLGLNIIEIKPELRRSLGDLHQVSLGLIFQSVDPEDELEQVEELVPGFARPLTFGERQYLGASLGYTLENVDNRHIPHRGIALKAKVAHSESLDSDLSFSHFSGQVSFYFPLNRLPGKVTLALRSGGARNVGDFAFYQANYLNGLKNVRGLRQNRFGGKGLFYQNVEIRSKLGKWANHVVPMEFGFFGFFDTGRVWSESDEILGQDTWHQGVGGGLYINLLDFVVLTTQYAWSDDDDFLSAKLGFQF